MLNHLISLIMCIHDPLCPLSFTSEKKKQLPWVQFQGVSWFKDHGTMEKVSETKDSSWDNTEGKNALTLYHCSLKSINQANFKVKETNILYKVTGINVYRIWNMYLYL